jgi:hypothetical protein
MCMTTGDELGKSDVFVKVAVMLSPRIEEAVRQGIAIEEFEHGLLRGWLCAGKQVIDQSLIAKGNGDLGGTTLPPTESSNDWGTKA